jgi:hypothetical protein
MRGAVSGGSPSKRRHVSDSWRRPNVLAAGTDGGLSRVTLMRLPPRDAGMAGVEDICHLDVTATGCETTLLYSAATVGRHVPALRSASPRAFALLASVRDSILGDNVELTGSDTAIAMAG